MIGPYIVSFRIYIIVLLHTATVVHSRNRFLFLSNLSKRSKFYCEIIICPNVRHFYLSDSRELSLCCFSGILGRVSVCCCQRRHNSMAYGHIIRKKRRKKKKTVTSDSAFTLLASAVPIVDIRFRFVCRLFSVYRKFRRQNELMRTFFSSSSNFLPSEYTILISRNVSNALR